ncbi:FAD-binding domain-containing protein [Plenodomus tracheiphilus IPT5]|uniref:FAD-binding domain-containing protein n=1 Tax=Plenodomus tracheiphilus IPT5 TaxID=1408161 RepID=A0A6A7BBH4_9PLEO|nr:FAD-binding domain-containing protein [Plenodomus tracheiphilus IPT5]
MRTSQFSSLVLLGLARGSIGATVRATTPAPFTAANWHWSNGTTISSKGSTEFLEATERWTIYMPPTYNVAISPATEDDVVKAVKAAQQHGLPFLATGGRHGYSNTLGEMQGGVAIDLSKLDTISVDKDAGTLTVGPGVHFGEIFDPLYEAGLQVQTGTATCPGMIGVTLGAGIGRLNGLQGLVIDALISARIVIANGTVLEISETSNPDLFWAVRGAGQNFGIVTSATYQAQPLYKDGVWTSVDIIVPLEKNVSYFEVVESMMPLPADLTVQTSIVYSTAVNSTQILVSLVYAGPEDTGLEAMAPILDLGPFEFKNVSVLAYNTVGPNSMFQNNAAFCGASQIFDVFGFNLKLFNPATMSSTLQKISDFFDEQPSARGSAILLESWSNQATVAVPDDATAYPWRDATTYGLIIFRWDTVGDPVEAAANKVGVELRSEYAETSGYGDLSVYVNYARGDESLESIYGANKLPKLVSLKAEYDPNNVFRFYHDLPTSYP